MNLTIAVVQSCSERGCRLFDIKSNETIVAGYSPLVNNRIRIRRDQIVVVDTSGAAPEILWRWRLGDIEVVRDGTVFLRDGCGNLVEADALAAMELTLRAGDRVIWEGGKTEVIITDRISSGIPEHPERLLQVMRPEIEAAYSAA